MTIEALRDTPWRITLCQIGTGRRMIESIFDHGKQKMEARNSYLLTVHQHAPPTLQRLINVRTCCFQMGSNIYRTLVEDVDAIAVESLLLRQGHPRDIEDLNEMGDVVLPKEVDIHYSSKRAEV